ncbi:DUF2628 domain-containing protein [Deltaproteobacteria bacterium OttesenSCG-928-M10]|nr:DUF2628 domain-containing protein [Deltaproteobacteria bacterium OttesenSCG-928-M10]
MENNVNDAMVSKEEFLELRSAYLKKPTRAILKSFAKYDEGQQGGVDIGGFLLSAPWLAYYKLYRHCLIFCVAVFALLVLINILALPNILGVDNSNLLALMAGAWVGIYGRKWYWQTANKAVATALKATNNDFQQAKALLAQQGGTNNIAAILVLLVALLLMFGGDALDRRFAALSPVPGCADESVQNLATQIVREHLTQQGGQDISLKLQNIRTHFTEKDTGNNFCIADLWVSGIFYGERETETLAIEYRTQKLDDKPGEFRVEVIRLDSE